ncbi:unnamed protein product [Brassicogethes aeneus]|uniref:Actin-related protein 10 n=1 Tax=Brassicogethes aeneus TaxID=1431903 RepID=A0A9P0BE77_BRAAE|nr:unnamed protein product [Brassicogethes aeneus]
MPIYEASTEKLTVVLDIGAAFTKFGFSGEFSPRSIFRSEVYCKKTKKTRRIIDFETPEDLYDLLVEFIHKVYFKYALLSPKDRPIIVVESLLCPTLFRETLAKVLFVHYEVSTMLVLPSHLVAASSLPAETALVVDIGYKEGVVIPICYGMPIVQAWQALPIGSEAIHNNLRSLLTSNNTNIQNVTEKVIEDIKVKCCFVTKKYRAEQLGSSKPEITACPDVKYPLGGSDTIIVPGKCRERTFEVLYEEDNDHLCLSTMILDAILKVDMDLRQQLAENMLLIGGTTMIPGFKSRLKEELAKQLELDRYKTLKIQKFKFHTLPCKENYAAWLGAAIYGATELINMNGLSRENYLKDSHLPDWIDLKDTNRSL